MSLEINIYCAICGTAYCQEMETDLPPNTVYLTMSCSGCQQIIKDLEDKVEKLTKEQQ